jgi:acetyltransferase-like isoleucine patch superfamily enzyme
MIFSRCKTFLRALTFYCYNAFVSHVPLYCLRHWYLRYVLRIRLGRDSAIHMGCFVTGSAIVIGRGTVVNRNTYLDGRGKLTIGDNVSISPGAYILSLDHDPQSGSFEAFPGPVCIEDYAWIGARAMILPSVTVRKGAVVGAGAVVTKNVEERSIVAGVPAKPIGSRTGDLHYSPRYFPYFNTDILPR